MSSPKNPAQHWLFKTEPDTYSFDQLLTEGATNWNNVRNFQARNFLRQARVGDLALIYHSGDGKAVVGVARVTREAYPDPDPAKKGDWVQIDLRAVRRLARPVGLSELKAARALAGLPLLKQSQLSCMAVLPAHYEAILKMSEGAASGDAPASGKKPGKKSR